MFALLDGVKPAKLVIDMRDNGGGDNTVGYAEVLKPLEARTAINRKGRLYVHIGAETFSAAMNNAAQFQDETAAILVGETIGEKPNSYQEPRQFRLPNSHLVVRASTLWYAFRKTGPNLVAPDRRSFRAGTTSRRGAIRCSTGCLRRKSIEYSPPLLRCAISSFAAATISRHSWIWARI